MMERDGIARNADMDFVLAARSWAKDPTEGMLEIIWKGYDGLKVAQPKIDPSDLERSITQNLELCARRAMSGYEPFDLQHGSYEHETMLDPPAQPPQYDLAFILRSDSRIRWPLEAKVMETPGTVADYIHDINDQYLTCRYAPFSSSAAMLGYLLSGSPADAFARIGKQLNCTMESSGSDRPQRVTRHVRSVPKGKTYPASFACHHLVLEFTGLKRARKS